ncbi:GNAT family N-acetyltransferase [Streptomyces sp. NPDC056323]|uniref:GNAT family N-acetyltransferase n=1 Tax=Streptomyces sp. NPDC056323 TaxID=3345784 RepID=UPI0035D7588C
MRQRSLGGAGGTIWRVRTRHRCFMFTNLRWRYPMRRGVGRDLLRAFMEAGAKAGATKMFLTTGEANMAARSLYESLGGGLAAQGPTVNYWFLLDPR